MNTQSIKRLVTFSPDLHRSAQIRAYFLGISLAEYLRLLVVNDTRLSNAVSGMTLPIRRKRRRSRDLAKLEQQRIEGCTEEELDVLE